MFEAGGVPPKVPSKVHLHVGLFEGTLPGWVEEHLEPIALRCDQYESAGGLDERSQRPLGRHRLSTTRMARRPGTGLHTAQASSFDVSHASTEPQKNQESHW
jgi:hypothetical protein